MIGFLYIINMSKCENFIKKSREIHNNKYDYSLVEYRNNKTKVEIICPIHGIFKQRPDNHIHGNGCPLCNIEHKKFTLNKFIEKSQKIHNNKYDYSLVNYINIKTKIKIICPIHGVFEQLPKNHLNGQGCADCFGNKLSSTEDFIRKSIKIHGNKYDYSLVNYKNDKTKVKIICPIHGEFEQMSNIHLQGHGCPSCTSQIISYGEETISEILNKNNVKYKTQKIFPNCKYILPLKFDFYLLNYNLCIEFDGEQHFKPNNYFGGIKGFEMTQKRDIIKNDYCKKNNIELIRISYLEINNIEKIINEKILKNN